MNKNIKANEVKHNLKSARWVTCGELRERFIKHPCRALSGKWVAYAIDGRPLGEVVYKKGIIVSKKAYERKRKNDRIAN